MRLHANGDGGAAAQGTANTDIGPTIETVGTPSNFAANEDDLLEWERSPVEVRFDREHDNLLDATDVTDAQRARLLEEYLDSISNVCPKPLLMPLKEGTKKPIGSPNNPSNLVGGDEAIDTIRDGHTGFALYAGREDHGTQNLVFGDHDDEGFRVTDVPETLTSLSGSGTGYHTTFKSNDDMDNGSNGDNSVRANNQFIVAPGSIHESGGVYHVVEDRDVATLQNTDIPHGLRQSESDDNDVELDINVNHISTDEKAQFTNDKELSLEHCRDVDDELDSLLSTAVGNGHDDSVIDAQLVSKLRYHHFDYQQIIRVWKQFRPRAKLRRRDYIRITIQECGTHGDRWEYHLSDTATTELAEDSHEGPNHFGSKVGVDVDISGLEGSSWNYGGIEREDVWTKRNKEFENGF